MNRPNWSAEHGAELRDRREAASVSRRALARAVGCTMHEVKLWETTAYGPGPARLALVEAVLATPPAPPRTVPHTRWALADRFDGERLRQLRQAAAIGLDSFARRLSTDVPHLRRWETGRNAPGAHYAVLICQELGCAPEDLCRPADQSHANQAT
jgi:DNA-binding transcriptional regulator YiaG